MTVSSTAATAAPYSGAGSPGPFAIPFYFLEDSHVVAVKTVDGTETTLVLDQDYTLTGAGDMEGGSLTLTDDLESGQTLTIELDPPFDQQATFPRNDPFPAATNERGLDKLTMLCKKLRDLLAVLRSDFDAVDLTEINATLAEHTDDIAALEASLAAFGLPDLEGYAYANTVPIPEGSVLIFSKSSDPEDEGALGASYMPVPRAYSPSALQQGIAAGFKFPSVHTNDDAGSVSVTLLESTDDWPIGIPQDFVQAGNGKFEIQIDNPMTSGIYLDAYEADRTAIGTYNSVSGAQVRSTGPGAMFRIVRASATVFIANGNLEDVP